MSMASGTTSYDGEYQRLLAHFSRTTPNQLRHTEHLFNLLERYDVARSVWEQKFMAKVLSVFIEVKAASGEIEPNSGVVREIITSALDFRYQRYTPEGTLGEFGVSLQLQSAAMVTLDNLGNMVSIIQGEVKEDRNEALDSLLKTLRNWAMDFADMMDKKDKRLAEQNQRESELGE